MSVIISQEWFYSLYLEYGKHAREYVSWYAWGVVVSVYLTQTWEQRTKGLIRVTKSIVG